MAEQTLFWLKISSEAQFLAAIATVLLAFMAYLSLRQYRRKIRVFYVGNINKCIYIRVSNAGLVDVTINRIGIRLSRRTRKSIRPDITALTNRSPLKSIVYFDHKYGIAYWGDGLMASVPRKLAIGEQVTVALPIDDVDELIPNVNGVISIATMCAVDSLGSKYYPRTSPCRFMHRLFWLTFAKTDLKITV